MLPKKKQAREVQLRCLYCLSQCTTERYYHHGGRIKSYLNNHICRNPVCKKYYVINKLIHQGNEVLLSTSIVNGDGQQSTAKKRRIVDSSTHQFTLTDFGLTGTTNSHCQPKLLASNHQLQTKLITLV